MFHRDLSHTSITSLPTIGLADLKTLVIANTPSLKEMPAVLSLSSLTTATLTYSQHCCAFEHPEVADKEAYEKFMAKVEMECSSTSTTSYKGSTNYNLI